MFCRHCPEKNLSALESTWESAVAVEKAPSLSDPLIKLRYKPNPPSFTIRDIIASITDAHEAFIVRPYQPPSVEERSQAMQRREQWRLLIRVTICFIVVIPTFLIGVIWMSLVSESDPVRKYFDESVWSGAAPRRDWALFILASIVMFSAAEVFHTRAIKEIKSLWRRGSNMPLLHRFVRFGSMNLLVSLGTAVAYFSSIAVLVMEATSTTDNMAHSTTYFDSVVFLTFFVLLG